MGIASEMKRLTQDIASSHQDRAKRLGQIREEASQTREEARSLTKGFQNSRRETATRLRNELTRDKAQRKAEAEGILKEAQEILRGFRTSRNEMSAQLKEDLFKGIAAKRSEVRQALAEAEKSIKGFKASRKKMRFEVTRELDQSRARVQSEVAELLGNAQSQVKAFQRSRREEGNKLRKELARNKAERESDVERMQSDFSKARSNLRSELNEATTAWRQLAGITAPPKAETREAAGETADLETKLLTAINQHSSGVTLTEVADSLGIAPIVLGRASRSLLEKGKLRKTKKLYFPVAGE